MGNKMGSVEVQQELTDMQKQLAKHEQLHEGTNKTLDKVSEAVVNQVKISEQIVALDRRHEDSAKAIHKRLDTMDVKVDSNHTQIMKWSGALGALVALLSVAGLAVSLFRAFG